MNSFTLFLTMSTNLLMYHWEVFVDLR